MSELGLTRTNLFLAILLVVPTHFACYTIFGIYFSWAIFFLGVLILFLSPHWGLVFYFFALLVHDDINKFDIDEPSLNSIFTTSISDFSISLIWSILIFVILILHRVNRIESGLNVAIPVGAFIFFFFLGLSRFYQFLNPAFIADIGFVINLILGYLLGERLLRKVSSVRIYFGFFLSVFIVKFSIISIQGVVSSISGLFYTFKAESASNFIVIPILLCLLVLFGHGLAVSKQGKTFFLLLMMLCLAYLFITISRERILLVAMALMVYLIFFRKFKVVFFAIFMAIAGFYIIQYTNPSMHNFIVWKLTTMIPTTDGNTLNASSSVRWIELLNICHEQIMAPYKLFIGTGWGGEFTSKFVNFSPEILGNSSFPNEWIAADKYYRPHGTYLYILLKYGLLGVFIFYGSLVYFSFTALKNWRKNQVLFSKGTISNLEKATLLIQLSVAFSLPLAALIIFTSKLQVLMGFLIYMVYIINKQFAQQFYGIKTIESSY